MSNTSSRDSVRELRMGNCSSLHAVSVFSMLFFLAGCAPEHDRKESEIEPTSSSEVKIVDPSLVKALRSGAMQSNTIGIATDTPPTPVVGNVWIELQETISSSNPTLYAKATFFQKSDINPYLPILPNTSRSSREESSGTASRDSFIPTAELSLINFGSELNLNGQLLARSASDENNFEYLFSTANRRTLEALSSERLTLKISGTSGTEHDIPQQIEVNHPKDIGLELIFPVLSSPVAIDKAKGVRFQWIPGSAEGLIQIIIESLAENGSERVVTGRIVLETLDNGNVRIGPDELAKLPVGKAEVAIKRIQIDGASSVSSASRINIFTVRSRVAPATLN